jgi:hypothetical protein
VNYIVRAINSPFHPHPRPYDDLTEAQNAARAYSLNPLDVGTPAYGVFEGTYCVAVAVDGVVYVRESDAKNAQV